MRTIVREKLYYPFGVVRKNLEIKEKTSAFITYDHIVRQQQNVTK
jgi:hypothetical protein